MAKKIIIAASILMVVLLCVSVGIALSSETSTDVPVVDLTQDESTTNADDSSDVSDNTEQETTTEVAAELSQLIIGKWRDSADMSGYEFFADGTFELTYVNLTIPFINLPIEGTAKGTYTINGDKITTSISIYTASIGDTFTASVEDSTLTLVASDGDKSTYSKVTSNVESESTTQSTDEVVYEDDELTGSWTNTDGSIEYTFSADGLATIELLTGSYSGIYFIQDDQITIQYASGSELITQNYTYSVSVNSMSLTDAGGTVTLWARSGTELDTSGSTDAESLLGTWTDSADMSGFNFYEGNVVDVTYLNFTIPVLNMPITGSYTGMYVATDGKLILNYTVSSQTISTTYTFSVSGDTLTLTNVDDGEVSTYTKTAE